MGFKLRQLLFGTKRVHVLNEALPCVLSLGTVVEDDVLIGFFRIEIKHGDRVAKPPLSPRNFEPGAVRSLGGESKVTGGTYLDGKSLRGGISIRLKPKFHCTVALTKSSRDLKGYSA